MWRVEENIAVEEQLQYGGIDVMRTFKQRINPFEQYREGEFFDKYRFPKEIFGGLVDILEPSLERFSHRSKALEPSHQLCTAVRYFAQGGFLPMIADVHGMSNRSASNCIHTVANAIIHRMDTFIQWPDADEITLAKQAFYERGRGFPCIAGLIDGSHVEVIGPHRPANEAAFVNRGGWHSINTQIVCGPDLKIFDLDARWPGSSHDSFILQNSHVWDRFENGLVPDSWILGDSGYPLKKWLLTPYATPGNNGQNRYNMAHKSIRSAIERCNGVWKMRWRCLTKPIMFQPARASRIIAACGALHNFAIQQRVPFNQVIDQNVMNAMEVDAGRAIFRNNNEGIRARNELVRRVFE
ncbi:putative nuclease HARBI1 [Lineus longissimus]|uniref:putative nuclease HARBI1 n=1 Tax=Lineus longissimus TaxID=88925 RepID=UPI00315C6BB0